MKDCTVASVEQAFKKQIKINFDVFFREQSMNMCWMWPKIRPLNTPGKWQEGGGINRWRLRGLCKGK